MTQTYEYEDSVLPPFDLAYIGQHLSHRYHHPGKSGTAIGLAKHKVVRTLEKGLLMLTVFVLRSYCMFKCKIL